jgi:hypothetical protein
MAMGGKVFFCFMLFVCVLQCIAAIDMINIARMASLHSFAVERFQSIKNTAQNTLPAKKELVSSGYVYMSYFKENECSAEPTGTIAFPVNNCHTATGFSFMINLVEGKVTFFI